MKNEFVLAFNEVLEEKQLPKSVVLEALEAAMVSAYRRAVNASNAQHVEAVIDPESGRVQIFAEKEVVETVEDPRTEVILRDAHKVDANARLGSMVIVETTPRNFGRVAAQTARQVIQQRIREAERDAQFSHYSKQMGEIMSGVIQAINAQGATLGLDMKAEGTMPRNQMIPGERFHVHDRVRALLLEVKTSSRGPQIILSRAHRNFLRRLLENEVPEIYHGMVEIRSIAREPGQRSKVAVAALQPGVDPVGACVGIRGVRIQAIVRELNEEKIDVIEWSSDPAVYIAKALSPARVAGVYLNEHAKGAKTATVVVPEDQLSLAIGRDGQNARLAAKLTSWRIDIKSLPEAANDALYKLHNDPQYTQFLSTEAEVLPLVELVLTKKSEGRPVTPEEYQVLTQFVDRIERGLIRQRQSDKRAEVERQRIESAHVPAAAFDIPLGSFPISDHVYNIISEAGFQTVGDLILQFRTDPDSILRLSGMGPKGMAELETTIDNLTEKLLMEEAEARALKALEQKPALEIQDIVPTVPETPVVEVIPEQPPVEFVETAVEQPVSELPEAEPVELAVEPEPVAVSVPEVTETTVVAEPVIEEVVETVQKPQEEEPGSLDEYFALQPEGFDFSAAEEEEDDDDETDRKKKKKKKKKFVEVEYDPDQDVTLVKKKRKRGGLEWDEGW